LYRIDFIEEVGKNIDILIRRAATLSSNLIAKFADDTTIVGLITERDESAYRGEVDTLTTWCQDNNLTLNISKTKEMIVDFRRRQEVEHAPLHINGSEVEKFSCFRFLGVNISNDLTWSDHFFCHVPDCFPSPITTSKETIVLFLHYINKLNCSQWFISLGQNHSYDEEVEIMLLLCAYINITSQYQANIKSNIKSNLSKKKL